MANEPPRNEAYLTHLTRSTTSMGTRSLSLDYGPPRPSSTTLLPALPPRIGSAAPVYTNLEALLRNGSPPRSERHAISSMSIRRNAENAARLQALTEAEDANKRSGRRQRFDRNHHHTDDDDGSGGGASSIVFHQFPSFSFGGGGYDGQRHAKPAARKTLQERTASIARAAHSTVRDDVVAKVSSLRTHTDVRLSFFQNVRDMKQQMAEERRERGMAVLHRNMIEARCATPAVVQERLDHSCQERDVHMSVVAARKQQVLDARKARFEDMVRRTNRTGTAFGDLAEIEREKQLIVLCSSWRNIVALASRAQQMFASLLVFRGALLEQVAQEEARKDMFHQHWKTIVRIQQQWRCKLRRSRIHRKYLAADVIRTFMQLVPRIQAQFRLAVRRTLLRVVAVQRHFRAIRVVRHVRRDAAVWCIDQFIRKTSNEIDAEVNQLHKQKKHAEAQCTSAIKARKPLFEAQISQLQAAIVDLSKRKFIMSALTEGSKREVVGRLMASREDQYRQLLRVFGLQVFEKYMIEFNIDKVMRDQQQRFNQDVCTTSITELRVVSAWELKRQAAKQRLHRPIMMLSLNQEDVANLFKEDGELTKYANEDFNAQTEQLYSKKKGYQ